MIEALKEEEVVNKVGGRFKLSTLIQKRLVALNAGARPLVDVDTNDKMEIVVEEILRHFTEDECSGQEGRHVITPDRIARAIEPWLTSKGDPGGRQCIDAGFVSVAVVVGEVVLLGGRQIHRPGDEAAGRRRRLLL